MKCPMCGAELPSAGGFIKGTTIPDTRYTICPECGTHIEVDGTAKWARRGRRALKGEEFLLAILLDMKGIVADLNDHEWWSEDSDCEADDYAYGKGKLWVKVLQAILDDAEESDLVDTLLLYPLEHELDKRGRSCE